MAATLPVVGVATVAVEVGLATLLPTSVMLVWIVKLPVLA